ncbi:MAG: hypothetical protein MK066_04340 [Crocinitomicaceae bacterium]|nr:hypothetical protein [Crocinitomicaceae bacterium]
MKKIFALFLLLFSFVACSDDDLETKIDIYCSCMSQANRGECDKMECVRLLDEINQEYSFDPESVEIIVQRMKDCV